MGDSRDGVKHHGGQRRRGQADGGQGLQGEGRDAALREERSGVGGKRRQREERATSREFKRNKARRYQRRRSGSEVSGEI